MTTEAQIQANRINAQKSTGPRTPEGKAKTAQNALKHGLFTRETVIRGEDQQEFEEYRENLLSQLIPGTPLEETLAERVVDLSWRLKRAARDQERAFVVLYQKQMAAIARSMGLGVEGVPPACAQGSAPAHVEGVAGANRGPEARDTEAAQRDAAIGWMIVEDFNGEAILDRLLRYERRIESSMYRALNELRRVHDQVQKARQHELDTLARWKEEDWEAKKRRLFRSCPPEVGSSVQDVVRGRTTHSGDAQGRLCEEGRPAMSTPVPGAAIVQNEPNWERDCGLEGQGLSEMCKTNPIGSEIAAWRGRD